MAHGADGKIYLRRIEPFSYTAPWGFHRPMGKLPPHEWVTTPWRYLLWLREHHICKGARPL